jgi:transposase
MTPRKPYRSDLTDAQGQRIKRLLPKTKAAGRARCDEREVLNGRLYVLWAGWRWEELPHGMGALGQTCDRRVLEYQRRRVGQRIVQDLLKEAYRRGKLNLKSGYHEASWVGAKEGRTANSAIEQKSTI